jgi:hypothetical protein
MFNPKVVSNFLSKEDCEYVVTTVSKVDTWEGAGNDFWSNRALGLPNLRKNIDPKVADIVAEATIKVKNAIMFEYGLDKEVYADLTQIIRWFPGMEQPPHADDMTNTEHRGFEHRVFGAIIYLNDNYSGGHTYYPEHNFEVIPKAGNLAIHPGDPEHLHGVTKIEDSTRYTIASFWTFDKSKEYALY